MFFFAFLEMKNKGMRNKKEQQMLYVIDSVHASVSSILRGLRA